MSKSLIRQAPERPGPITEAIWLDSVGGSKWGQPSEHHAVPTDLIHRSVGYVLEETELSLTLLQSVGGTGLVDHSLTIPKVALLSRSVRR